jgi:putative intracellular protease/amidase
MAAEVPLMHAMLLRSLASSALAFFLSVVFALSALAQDAPRKQAAIFVFEGVQVLDFTGPYEAFGAAGFEVFTVGEKEGPLTTAGGMSVTPRYTFANAPRADVVVYPGGDVESHFEKPAVIEWVKKSAQESGHVLSVCNGAFFAGKAGLLDGLSATTYAALIDRLQEIAPKCRVVRDQRRVDNGKIVTAAGISAGIDGALHVVEKMTSRGKAQEAALGMEYDWRPDVNWARANLAEMQIRRMLGRTGFDIPTVERWTCVSTQGDADKWEKRWEAVLDSSVADLTKIVEAKLAASKWKRVEGTASTDASGGASDSAWTFEDARGGPWTAKAHVESVAGSPRTFRLSLRVERARAGS